MLEAKVEALTAAIVALNCTLIDVAKRGPIVGADPAAIASVKTGTAAPAKAAAPKAPAANDAKIGYAEVQVPFLALAKAKGREAALAIIAPMKSLKEIEAGEQHTGQYAELLAKIKEAA